MAEDIFTPAEDAEFVERSRVVHRVELKPADTPNVSDEDARRAAALFG